MRPVDLFHVGPQKAATTWVYQCLREHPGVACPETDAIHYYDIFHARGPDWYAKHFAGARDDQLLFDPTYTYLRAPWAAERIAADSPRARIVVCLRDPIERAFSHYWHEKKKRVIGYDFSDVLRNYDLFASWIEPGFYARHLARYLDHLPREQILCQRYEVLEADPRGFLDALLRFAGLPDDFAPSVLRRRVNPAGPLESPLNPAHWINRVGRSLRRLPAGEDALEAARRWGRPEYERGVPAELHARLLELLEPEIAALEEMLGEDFSAWRRARP